MGCESGAYALVGGDLEPVEGRIASGGEGPATDGAAIPPSLAAMDGDVAEAESAPCGAIEVVAGLALRVHRHLPPDTGLRPCLEKCLVDPRISIPYPPHSRFNGVLPQTLLLPRWKMCDMGGRP